MPAKSRKKKEKEPPAEGLKRDTKSVNDEPPFPIVPYRRIAIRTLIAVILMIAMYLYNEYKVEVRPFVRVSETVEKRYESVQCSKDYDSEMALFPDCVPKKCGRVVSDVVITEAEATHLLRTAKRGLSFGGSNGGASILDLHSGALSKGDKFVDVYSIMKEQKESVFTQKDFDLYNKVKTKIHKAISGAFDVKPESLHLTKPTFFSRMTTKPAQTVHDEYWHVHTDKETYGSFHYTSLLYLSTYEKQFTGGRFVFVDGSKNVTVDPKLGRLSFFTSGSENPHFVERVSSGTRFALTVSFTCDPSKAIADPDLK